MRVNHVARSTLTTIWRWLPALIWMGWIFYLSNQSSPPHVTKEVDPYLGHAALYGALALLVFIALPPDYRASHTTLAAIAAFTIAVFYGVSDEIHQLFIPDRVASAADLAADAVGASISVTVSSVIAASFSGRSGSTEARD